MDSDATSGTYDGGLMEGLLVLEKSAEEFALSQYQDPFADYLPCFHPSKPPVLDIMAFYELV